MTLYFTEKEQIEFEAAQKRTHFSSNLGFINATNGLRRGSMHLFIAGTGGGKSTLTRTLIRDLLFHRDNDPIICLWLSEETIQEYKAMFALSNPPSDRLLNTNAYSEQDNQGSTEMHLFEWIEMISPDIFVYDNITTSKFYDGKRPDQQATFAARLKNVFKKVNCAGVVIAHADAQQTQQRGGLLDLNNIRGSKAICNLTEFAYLFQTFKTAKATHSILRIAKSRSQHVIHDTYLLNYEPKLMSYLSDTAIPFEKFKEAFNERHKL
jgi:hypothetical protein